MPTSADDCAPDCNCKGPCRRYTSCEGCPGDCGPACTLESD